MSALPSDIGPALRAASIATWSDATVKDRFPSARDGAAAPREGFCDSVADAVALASFGALLEAQSRRRFSAQVDGPNWLDPSTGVPIAKLVDQEQVASGYALTSRIEEVLDEERTNLELYG